MIFKDMIEKGKEGKLNSFEQVSTWCSTVRVTVSGKNVIATFG